MKFGELKKVINRSAGRHMWCSISIGLGVDAVIQAESPLLDVMDDFEVAWIGAASFGEETVTDGRSTVTDEQEPCLEIHLKERKEDQEGEE